MVRGTAQMRCELHRCRREAVGPQFLQSPSDSLTIMAVFIMAGFPQVKL